MNKIINNIKSRLGFIGAIFMATIVGGITSASVLAAIPDSNGQINACYKNSSGAVQLTDPAGNCGSKFTAISWDQSGWKGYGYIKDDGTIDATRSKNITSAGISSISGDVYCITASFPPSLISATAGFNSGDVVADVRGVNTSTDSNIDYFCGTGTNVIVQGTIGGDSGFYVFLR